MARRPVRSKLVQHLVSPIRDRLRPRVSRIRRASQPAGRAGRWPARWRVTSPVVSWPAARHP